MHDFKFKKETLYCESVPVSRIAKGVGTPFYLYSYKTLTDHLAKIQKAFKAIDPLICFAMKANDNMAVIKALADQGAGCDIVSIGELKKALRVKVDPQKIVFASVGKTEEEITTAIKAGIRLFNVESLPELEQINALSGRLKKKSPVALRINPDVKSATHDRIMTGTLEKKFGIDLKTAAQIFRDKEKYSSLDITGVHIHIGSQILSTAPFINAIKKTLSFIDNMRREGIHVTCLDIGGGWGIIYKNEKAHTAQALAKAVMPLLKKSRLKIIMEPGRFIVGNAGIFVTKVLYLKNNGYKKFIIVDGGMNDLMRPSLYNAYHEIVPVQRKGRPALTADVVGPICESGDFFAKDRRLPRVNPGDLLAIMGAGAYGYVMASNYNVRGRVPEIMVKGHKWAMIKKRETFKDLIRGESIPDFLVKK